MSGCEGHPSQDLLIKGGGKQTTAPALIKAHTEKSWYLPEIVYFAKGWRKWPLWSTRPKWPKWPLWPEDGPSWPPGPLWPIEPLWQPWLIKDLSRGWIITELTLLFTWSSCSSHSVLPHKQSPWMCKEGFCLVTFICSWGGSRIDLRFRHNLVGAGLERGGAGLREVGPGIAGQTLFGRL